MRNRREDIAEIAVSFLKASDYKNYKSNEAMWHEIIDELSRYDLRGNIRELQNILERLTVMMKNSRITTSALFSEISNGLSKDDTEEYHKYIVKNQSAIKYDDSENTDIAEAMKNWEKKRIIAALKNNSLSRTKAAKELGMSRSTLWSKMKIYNIKI